MSYGLRKTTAPKHASKAFAALRPVLQRAAGNGNTVSNQVGGASERANVVIIQASSPSARRDPSPPCLSCQDAVRSALCPGQLFNGLATGRRAGPASVRNKRAVLPFAGTGLKKAHRVSGCAQGRRLLCAGLRPQRDAQRQPGGGRRRGLPAAARPALPPRRALRQSRGQRERPSGPGPAPFERQPMVDLTPAVVVCACRGTRW